MWRLKLEKPSCNNWLKSQNKNSFLFQALQPKLKSCHTCQKPGKHVGQALQKIHQHRQIFWIYCKRKMQKQITPSTGRSAWNKWSYLHKLLSIRSQQQLSSNYKRRQKSYNSPYKRLSNYMSRRITTILFWPSNQNKTRRSQNQLRHPHRRKYKIHLPKYHPPVSLQHKPFRALPSPKRQLRGRSWPHRQRQRSTNLKKTSQRGKWSYSKLVLP